MNQNTVAQLDPPEFWQAFAQISNIPRASRNEAVIIAHIAAIAKAQSLEYRQDAVGNLLVRLPPSPEMQDRPGLILQGHVDMVCEKDNSTRHDFDHDPIELVLDGEWLRANHTTLGADNGIAVAMMITLMQGAFKHGPVDLLFTIDEETGLTGAMNLDPSMLNFRNLINIDGEEEGIFYIGCAGGKETIGTLPMEFQPLSNRNCIVKISLGGLVGGHSGADIHRQPGNALHLLSRLLWTENMNFDFHVMNFHGGDKHNAICREAFCILALNKSILNDFKKALDTWKTTLIAEYGLDEPSLYIQLDESIQNEKIPEQVLSPQSQAVLLRLIYSMPHGVLTMSRTMPGMVSSSTNLAAVRFQNNSAELITSQRSDIQSVMEDAAQSVRAHLEMAGASWQFTREYPGWTPQPGSPLLKRLADHYRHFNPGKEPVIASIHAGLECGVIGSRQSGMDMVSIGPDIRGAHTPQEKVHIASTARVWRYLLSFLAEA